MYVFMIYGNSLASSGQDCNQLRVLHCAKRELTVKIPSVFIVQKVFTGN